MEHFFFNEIQIYFRQAESSDSRESYFISNNILSSQIDIENDKIGMIKFIPVSMNSIHRMVSIINVDKK